MSFNTEPNHPTEPGYGRCSVCHKDRDCSEVYKWAGEEPMEYPKLYCNQCLEKERLRRTLCDECFHKLYN